MSSISLTLTDKKLIERLPSPIAILWWRFHDVNNDTEKFKQAVGTLDAFLRYTSGLVFAAYLRHPSCPKVEGLIGNFIRPSLGHYEHFIETTLKYLRRCEDVFLDKILEWYFTDQNKLSEQAKALKALLPIRNEDAHGKTRVPSEMMNYTANFAKKLRRFLQYSPWLQAYQVFTVEDSKWIRRHNLYEGNIRFHMGKTSLPSEKRCWRLESRAYELCEHDGNDVVYISHPSGKHFLEVSPFFQYKIQGRRPSFYVWVSIPKKQYFSLRCEQFDKEDEQYKPMSMIEDKHIPVLQWLVERAELDGVRCNGLPADFSSGVFLEVGMIVADRWEIKERLGIGAMGVVYRAWDKDYKEDCAIKILHARMVDWKIVKRAKQEFVLMNRLNHQHILSVKDHETLLDGRFCLKMPLMKQTIKEVIQEEETITAERIAKWGRQLLSALEAMHCKGIIHRDIKPSNILLDEDDNTKLADFGVSKIDREDLSLTGTGDQLGTRKYMAPEVVHDSTLVSSASDRYSLAMTLHEACTGRTSSTPGKGIEGILGQKIRQLGHFDAEERMKVEWSLSNEASDLEETEIGFLNVLDDIIDAIPNPIIDSVLDSMVDKIGGFVSSSASEESLQEEGLKETPENYIVVEEPLSLPVEEKKEEQGFQLLLKLTDPEAIESLYEKGVCSEEGRGVAEDQGQAFLCYVQAAEHGHAKAQYRVGVCFSEGIGVEQNQDRAFEWYLKAAEQGNVKAQYKVGICFSEELGTVVDIEQSLVWLLKAAEGYAEGIGVQKDQKKSFKCYLQAAEQGHVDSQYTVAKCYSYGTGVQEDKEKAFEWYLKAAEQGNVKAQNRVVNCYEYGLGVAEDKEKVFEWLLCSAELGSLYAQNRVAECYSEGTGVEEDKEKAFEWYLKAAEQGQILAKYKVAECYDNGLGVAEDKEKASQWRPETGIDSF